MQSTWNWLPLLIALIPVDGITQETAPDTQRIADTMVRLCVGGGRTETTSGGGTGGADLSLRSLDVTGNLKGEFKISKSSAEGLINGLDNALSQVAAEQADKVRTCLQPVRERLLDLWLPLQHQSGSRNRIAIDRVADLRKLGCSNGDKRDVSSIVDIYEIEPPEPFYHPVAEVLAKQNVLLFDIHSGSQVAVNPTDDVHNPDGQRRVRWTVPVLAGRAIVQYDWTNGFLGNEEEGLEFMSNDEITHISGTVILPSDTQVQNVQFRPSKISDKCVVTESEPSSLKFSCYDLRTSGPIDVTWKWDIWKNCKIEAEPSH